VLKGENMGWRIRSVATIAVMLSVTAAYGKEYGDILGVTFAGIVDGDTFKAELGPPASLPEIFRIISVRLKGVDTPEKSPLCKSRLEAILLQKKALEAAQFTLKRLSEAKRIDLLEVERGARFRLVARVVYDRKELAAELLEAKLAKPMRGKKRPKWCEPPPLKDGAHEKRVRFTPDAGDGGLQVPEKTMKTGLTLF